MCSLFLSRSKILTFYPEYRTSPVAHLTSCSVDVVDPSPALKQLMHEADHSPLFSADVTDHCSCDCASLVCLHGVHLFWRSDSNVYVYMIQSRRK